MTSADLKDLVPAHAQEKLEWVTPKISLLDADDTDRKVTTSEVETIRETHHGPS